MSLAVGPGLSAFGAAQNAIQFDVFLGYDQVTREGNWFPVVCEIQNSGPSFKAMVELSPNAAGKVQSQQMPVELPTGTLKRISIPAFAGGRYAGAWDVRLLDERGRVVAEQTFLRPRVQVGWETILLGSLSRTAGGAPVIAPIAKKTAELQPLTARFQPSIFPDNPLVLEGLDAIYLSSEVAVTLRNEQINALLAWLNGGGHLIVGMEQISDITSQPWLRDVLPLDPKDSKLVQDHSQLQDWVGGTERQVSLASAASPSRSDTSFEIADLPVLTGVIRRGHTLISAGDTPLVVTASQGMGRVTALAFSPEREPFRSWRNAPMFWAKLIGVPDELYVSGNDAVNFRSIGASADGIFGAMIDSRQVRKLPIEWLLLLLVIYLVVIGPFDRWWLRKIGRPMLTWVTFPCYVVLFSLAIYVIGYKLRAGETEYNELHVVDVLRKGRQAELRGRTFASIYSPSNARFPLASKQKFATIRGEFTGAAGGSAIEQASVLQRGDSFEAEVFVPVWTSQLYVSDWWQGASLPCEVKISPDGDGWSVTVENHTEQALKQVQVVIDEAVYPLGEVRASDTKTARLTMNASTQLSAFVRANGARFMEVVQQRQRAFGSTRRSHLDDLPDASMAASFIRHLENRENYESFVLPRGLDLGDVVSRGDAVVLAWTPDYAPVAPMNQFKARRGFRDTLWRIPVSMSTTP